MFFSLIPLAVVAAIVFAVVSLARRSRARVDRQSGSEVIRSLFQYGLLLVALIVATAGIAALIGTALGGPAVSRSGSDVATPLALTVVGVPTFWLVARWIWRGLTTDTRERAGVGWSLYLSAALLISLATAIVQAFVVADWLLGDSRYDGETIGLLVAWTAAWGLHWAAWRLARPTRWPGLHLYVGAAIGLGVLGVSAGWVVSNLIEQIVSATAGVVAKSGLGEDLRLATSGIVIGAVVWGWYWLRHGVGAQHTVGRQIHVMLSGVLAGLVAAVSGGAVALFHVLVWFFGDPAANTAASHFTQLAVPGGIAVVGFASWAYHRAVVDFGRPQRRREIDRLYDHTVSFVALITTAAALTILIVAIFEVLTPEVAISPEASDSNVLLAAVTMLIVGVPLWAVSWSRAQKAVERALEEEAASITRRTYLFALFGLGGAVAFGGLIWLLIVLFDAAAEGFVAEELSRDLSVPVALLVTTGAIAGYHWLVFRAERHVGERQVRKSVLLVCGGQPDVAALEERAHARVTLLERLDVDAGPPVDLDEVVAAIERAGAQRVLVMADAAGVQAVPYR